MTAINVVISSDAAHMISDGVAIDSIGRSVHPMQKVTPIAHLNAAVGVRGTRAAASAIVDAIQSGAVSYDHLHKHVADILRATIEPARAVWESKFGPHVLACDVIVAGWSETRGPHAYVVATSDANVAHGLPAFVPVEIAGMIFMPSDTRLTVDFARLQLELATLRPWSLLPGSAQSQRLAWRIQTCRGLTASAGLFK
jgi:hypothetical protein